MERERDIDRQAESLIAGLLARSGDAEKLAGAPPVAATVLRRARALLARRPRDRKSLIAAWLRGLSHRSARVRFECAHALDAFGDASCRDGLVALMDDPVPRVRRMAIHALACDGCKDELFLGDDEARRRIADRALNDPSVQVRRHAVWAVGRAGGETARGTLAAVVARETDAAVLRNAHAAIHSLETQTAAH